jgi:exodeoxyribonuclease X
VTQAVILDTETTGKEDPEPIEVAMLHVASLSPLTFGQSFSERFYPRRKQRIELGAMATHGITLGDLDGCRPAEAFALPHGVEYVIGHAIDYDIGAIGSPAVKAIDTCAMARHLWPKFDSHGLFACLFGLVEPYARTHARASHGALADVLACGELLREILRVKPCATFEELFALSERCRVPTTWPFGKLKGQPLAAADDGYVRWVLTKMDPPPDPYLRKALEARR